LFCFCWYTVHLMAFYCLSGDLNWRCFQ
jgi:hypothetical protein